MFDISTNKLLCQFKSNISLVGAGVGYWLVFMLAIRFLGPLIDMPENGSDDIGVLSYILLITLVGSGFLGIHLAVRGCDFDRQYAFGTYGHLLKFFAILLTAFLVIPLVFWTGRKIFRFLSGEVQIVE